MEHIRWKRRLRGWAGFIGTSRAAAVRVVGTNVEFVTGPLRFRAWTAAPDVGHAVRWAESQWARQYDQLGDYQVVDALFVRADGTSERRQVDRISMFRHVAGFAPERQMLPDTIDVASPYHPNTIVFTARRWSVSIDDAFTGQYASLLTHIYVEDGIAPKVERHVAMAELFRIGLARGISADILDRCIH